MRESGCTGDAIAFTADIVAIGTAGTAAGPVRQYLPEHRLSESFAATRRVPGRCRQPRRLDDPAYSPGAGSYPSPDLGLFY